MDSASALRNFSVSRRTLDVTSASDAIERSHSLPNVVATVGNDDAYVASKSLKKSTSLETMTCRLEVVSAFATAGKL